MSFSAHKQRIAKKKEKFANASPNGSIHGGSPFGHPLTPNTNFESPLSHPDDRSAKRTQLKIDTIKGAGGEVQKGLQSETDANELELLQRKMASSSSGSPMNFEMEMERLREEAQKKHQLAEFNFGRQREEDEEEDKDPFPEEKADFDMTAHFTVQNEHLYCFKRIEKVVVDAEMTGWLSSVEKSFLSNRYASKLVMMPGANKMRKLAPMTGFAACVLDHSDNPPVLPGSFLFETTKFSFGTTAVRIPPENTAFYEVMSDPCQKPAVLEKLRNFLANENGSGGKMDYPGSCIGVYQAFEKSSKGVRTVFWVVCMEGSKAGNDEFDEYIHDACTQKKTWNDAFFSKDGGERVSSFIKKGSAKRASLISQVVTLFGAEDVPLKNYIDVPHFSFHYESSNMMFIYLSNAAFVKKAQSHILAISPTDGFVIMEGTKEKSGVKALSKEWNGNVDFFYTFPVVTGKRMESPTGVEMSEEMEKDKPELTSQDCVIDSHGNTEFARKNPDMYNQRDVNFRHVESLMGRNHVLSETQLVPVAVVVKNSIEKADFYRMSAISTLVDDY